MRALGKLCIRHGARVTADRAIVEGKLTQLIAERGAFRFMSADRAKELFDKISPRLRRITNDDRIQLGEEDVRRFEEYPLGYGPGPGIAYRWKPAKGREVIGVGMTFPDRPSFSEFMAIYRIKLTEGV